MIRPLPNPLALAIALGVCGAPSATLAQAAAADQSDRLSPSAEDEAKGLDNVQVVGFRAEQAAGEKYQRPLQETPRIITVLPNALLREQGATLYRLAVRVDPLHPVLCKSAPGPAERSS